MSQADPPKIDIQDIANRLWETADELLATLKRDKIVLDWRKQQATRAAVRVAVRETLDE